MQFLAEVNLQAGIRRTSPSFDIPMGVRKVSLELTSSNWNSKVGTGDLEFGIEYSSDGGSSWSLLTSASGPISEKGKGIYLPTLNYSRGTDLIGKVRAYAVASIDIRIGINGTIG